MRCGKFGKGFSAPCPGVVFEGRIVYNKDIEGRARRKAMDDGKEVCRIWQDG